VVHRASVSKKEKWGIVNHNIDHWGKRNKTIAGMPTQRRYSYTPVYVL
jgi:hypothetical protein